MIKRYDKEYSTQYPEEMKFLRDKGIRYTFVKTVNEITVYKYTKTRELFEALTLFYAEHEVKQL